MFLSLISVYIYVIFQCCIYVCCVLIKTSYLLTYLTHKHVTDVDDRMCGNVADFAMHDVTHISNLIGKIRPTPHPKGFSAVGPTDLPLSFD